MNTTPNGARLAVSNPDCWCEGNQFENWGNLRSGPVRAIARVISRARIITRASGRVTFWLCNHQTRAREATKAAAMARVRAKNMATVILGSGLGSMTCCIG